MDPDATLALIADEDADKRDRLEACCDLRDWLGRGGFAPKWSEHPEAHVYFIGATDRWLCECGCENTVRNQWCHGCRRNGRVSAVPSHRELVCPPKEAVLRHGRWYSR